MNTSVFGPTIESVVERIEKGTPLTRDVSFGVTITFPDRSVVTGDPSLIDDTPFGKSVHRAVNNMFNVSGSRDGNAASYFKDMLQVYVWETKSHRQPTIDEVRADIGKVKIMHAIEVGSAVRKAHIQAVVTVTVRRGTRASYHLNNGFLQRGLVGCVPKTYGADGSEIIPSPSELYVHTVVIDDGLGKSIDYLKKTNQDQMDRFFNNFPDGRYCPFKLSSVKRARDDKDGGPAAKRAKPSDFGLII